MVIQRKVVCDACGRFWSVSPAPFPKLIYRLRSGKQIEKRAELGFCLTCQKFRSVEPGFDRPQIQHDLHNAIRALENNRVAITAGIVNPFKLGSRRKRKHAEPRLKAEVDGYKEDMELVNERGEYRSRCLTCFQPYVYHTHQDNGGDVLLLTGPIHPDCNKERSSGFVFTAGYLERLGSLEPDRHLRFVVSIEEAFHLYYGSVTYMLDVDNSAVFLNGRRLTTEL